MTGHGRSIVEDEGLIVVAEIRAVNNRFLKTSVHADLPGSAIAKTEALIKQHVARGTVTVKIRQQWLARPSQFQLNLGVIQEYRNQLSTIEPVNIKDVLHLPGVVDEQIETDDADAHWPVIERAMLSALDHFNEMRALEGETTAADLKENCQLILSELRKIESQAPVVVEQYAKKLTERIQQMLQSHDLKVDEVSVVREVGIFSDRADISKKSCDWDIMSSNSKKS